MVEFEKSLGRAAGSLDAREGIETADALEAAFARAGERIEQSLSRAARTGELDFERMAESILRDLARIAAEALVLSNGRGGGATSVNFNLSAGAPQEAGLSRSALSAALMRLVSAGSRFT